MPESTSAGTPAPKLSVPGFYPASFPIPPFARTPEAEPPPRLEKYPSPKRPPALEPLFFPPMAPPRRAFPPPASMPASFPLSPQFCEETATGFDGNNGSPIDPISKNAVKNFRYPSRHTQHLIPGLIRRIHAQMIQAASNAKPPCQQARNIACPHVSIISTSHPGFGSIAGCLSNQHPFDRIHQILATEFPCPRPSRPARSARRSESH